MNPQNPYQTPQAQPANPYNSVPSAKLTWKQILFSFEGRIPRSTYWLVYLVSTLLFLIPVIVLIAMADGGNTGSSSFALILMLVVAVPYIWVTLAIQVKRWHDRDKSGWWIFINMIPYIGGIWAFVENGCLRGTVGPNQYGQDPTG